MYFSGWVLGFFFVSVLFTEICWNLQPYKDRICLPSSFPPSISICSQIKQCYILYKYIYKYIHLEGSFEFKLVIQWTLWNLVEFGVMDQGTAKLFFGVNQRLLNEFITWLDKSILSIFMNFCSWIKNIYHYVNYDAGYKFANILYYKYQM